MYLPRRPTPVMSALRSWRSNAGARKLGRDAFEIEFGGEDATAGDDRATRRGRRVRLQEVQAYVCVIRVYPMAATPPSSNLFILSIDVASE